MVALQHALTLPLICSGGWPEEEPPHRGGSDRHKLWWVQSVILDAALMTQRDAPQRALQHDSFHQQPSPEARAPMHPVAGHMQQNADLELPLELNPYEAGLVLERGAMVLHRLEADSRCIACPLCECRGVVGGVRRLAHV